MINSREAEYILHFTNNVLLSLVKRTFDFVSIGDYMEDRLSELNHWFKICKCIEKVIIQFHNTI